jgi:hypothetical protein
MRHWHLRRMSLCALIITAAAHAGGTSYMTTIESMQQIESDHYRLVVMTRALSSKPSRIVLHLKYRPRALGFRPPSRVTRAAYTECIERFKEHFRKHESFPLGVMGTGIVPIPKKPGEYQSNALVLLEEYRGDRVCYSFANPV